MKYFLLLVFFISTHLFSHAQNTKVTSLPPGKYEMVIKNSKDKWEQGDIRLLDDGHYTISTSKETGEYRFSVTAQRIFFTSGPLKSIYAKTMLVNNTPTIILPVAENEQTGFKLAAEVNGMYKQERP
jgi:hypothetical protein